MFNSSILDVVLGLVFSFLAVSLVASALVEAMSSVMNLRAKGLVTAMKRLLNDPGFRGLALRLYQHTGVNPAGVLTAADLAADPDAVDLRHPPAYVEPRQFATALMDVAGLSATAARDYASASEALSAMAPAFDALRADNPQLADLLGGIVLRSQGKLDLIETAIAGWFDASMDRLGGTYKRKTQVGCFVLAFGVAGLLNVDAIRIGRVLWEQPALADSLKLPPEATRVLSAKVAQQAPVSGPAADPALGDATAAEAMLAVLDRHLPVGWETDQLRFDGWQAWALRGLGWFVVAVASLFGAPFWFDILQTVVRIKGSGPSPGEKRVDQAASA